MALKLKPKKTWRRLGPPSRAVREGERVPLRLLVEHEPLTADDMSSEPQRRTLLDLRHELHRRELGGEFDPRHILDMPESEREQWQASRAAARAAMLGNDPRIERSLE